MHVVRITDRAGWAEQLRDFEGLTDVALRRVSEPAGGLYIAESSKVIARALAAGHQPRSVLLLEQWLPDVSALLENFDVPVFVGDSDVLQGITLARHRLNLANLLDDAASAGVGAFVVSPPPTADAELNERLEVLVEAQADVCSRRGVPFVDCYTPLSGHDQWRTDLAVSRVPNHPGQAGYGLIAWLVLHNGWNDWLQIS